MPCYRAVFRSGCAFSIVYSGVKWAINAVHWGSRRKMLHGFAPPELTTVNAEGNTDGGHGATMKTLVYKRTHKGDPDARGRFGIEDCRGRVRGRDFDAVIGIGGIGSYAKSEGISGKVNWIGLGPKKKWLTSGRGPAVVFDHFVLFEEKGPDFESVAPVLAERAYSRNARILMNFNNAEKAEIRRILKLAKNAPPSTGTLRMKMRCKPKPLRPCYSDSFCIPPTIARAFSIVRKGRRGQHAPNSG